MSLKRHAVRIALVISFFPAGCDETSLSRTGEDESASSAVGGGGVPFALGGSPGPDHLVFEGTSQSGFAGYSIAEVGDFNGDDFNDYLVGAYGESAAYLVLGGTWLQNTSSAIELNPQLNQNIVGIFGESTTDRLGRSVAPAGDVNGDGLADFVVGAYYGDHNGSNAGSAYVVFGHPITGWAIYASGIRSGAYPAIALDGASSGDYAGFSVGPAGDFRMDDGSECKYDAAGDLVLYTLETEGGTYNFYSDFYRHFWADWFAHHYHGKLGPLGIFVYGPTSWQSGASGYEQPDGTSVY